MLVFFVIVNLKLKDDVNWVLRSNIICYENEIKNNRINLIEEFNSHHLTINNSIKIFQPLYFAYLLDDLIFLIEFREFLRNICLIRLKKTLIKQKTDYFLVLLDSITLNKDHNFLSVLVTHYLGTIVIRLFILFTIVLSNVYPVICKCSIEKSR